MALTEIEAHAAAIAADRKSIESSLDILKKLERRLQPSTMSVAAISPILAESPRL